jgi:hypothetical protein
VTQKLNDLFQEFSSLSTHEQLEKVREIRNARTIERPVAAKKRIKKEGVKKEKAKSNAATLFKALTPEQQAEVLAKLGVGK